MDYISKICLNRKKIREIATFVRKTLLEIDTINFPVLKVLEKMVEKFSKILYYDVVEDIEFEKNVMAKTKIEPNNMYCIKIVKQYMKMQLKDKVQV